MNPEVPVKLVPPPPVVRLAVAVVVPTLVLAVVAYATGGGVAALGVLLGVVAGASVAFVATEGRVRLGVGACSVAALLAGLEGARHPWVAVVGVAVAGLAQAWFNRRVAGGAVMVPVLVAIAATAGLPDEPVRLPLWLAAGFAGILAIARLLGIAGPPETVDARTSRLHALAMAGGGAVAMALALWVIPLPHAYWFVLTLALVLRPVPGETRRASRDRVLGTAAGTLGAVALVLTVPTWASLAAGLACLVLTLAWSVAREPRHASAYGAALVVLVSSSGLADPGVELAAERLVLTLGGVLLAAGVALAVERADAVLSRGSSP